MSITPSGKMRSGELFALLAQIGMKSAEMKGDIIKDMFEMMESSYNNNVDAALASAKSRELESVKLIMDGSMSIAGGLTTFTGSSLDANAYRREANLNKRIDAGQGPAKPQAAPVSMQAERVVDPREVDQARLAANVPQVDPAAGAAAPVVPAVPEALPPTANPTSLAGDPTQYEVLDTAAKQEAARRQSKLDFKSEHLQWQAISQAGNILGSIGKLATAVPTNMQAAEDIKKGSSEATAQLSSSLNNVFDKIGNGLDAMSSSAAQVSAALAELLVKCAGR